MPAERTTMRHVREVLRLKGATATIKFFLDDVQQAAVRPLDQCQRSKIKFTDRIDGRRAAGEPRRDGFHVRRSLFWGT